MHAIIVLLISNGAYFLDIFQYGHSKDETTQLIVQRKDNIREVMLNLLCNIVLT